MTWTREFTHFKLKTGKIKLAENERNGKVEKSNKAAFVLTRVHTKPNDKNVFFLPNIFISVFVVKN